MSVRLFALISGVVYLLVGILGFIPGLVALPTTAPDLAVEAGYGYLLGIFPINVLHNIVHLAVGFWGVLSYRSYSGSRNYSKGLAIFYGLLTIMGFFPVLQTTFGLIPIFGHDIWLHALTALIAAYFGFMAKGRSSVAQEHERTPVGGRDRY
ncbi:DUF4383 domain-containing protein [Nodosilinea sp. LEGE 06152]|uniref:DUF4383 domain-containing protein n=1 Tax=Nodosilinea sp. LEGE 06152 TaxID=2777966 RepID=UPI00187F75E6|nr:DUF4383 domain-containing protein [Nodosilinea sp. LEGE 06152]